MSVKKYLNLYCEKEVLQLQSFSRQYQYVLVIPAYNESGDFLDQVFAKVSDLKEVLLILVVNTPDSKADDCSEYRQSLRLLKTIQSESQQVWRFQPTNPCLYCHELEGNKQLDILLVDRCSQQLIPEKQGVGLARKIGCDIALSLINDNVVTTPWIYSTDADVGLPEDYFTAVSELDDEINTCVYGFKHVYEEGAEAGKYYEFGLNYYVAGLQWARSNYAYHTIGSIMAFRYTAYAEVRGIPKRSAGEDFYLLNKLAKPGNIVQLKSPVIQIAGRLSDRVPFGTGPAIQKLNAMESPEQEYLYYHPKCFEYLKVWLCMIDLLWEYQGSLKESWTYCDIVHQVDRDKLLQCLEALDVREAIDHSMEQSRTKEIFVKHLHIWFDSFKTMKFIHTIRDSFFPSVPLESVRELCPFVRDVADFQSMHDPVVA